MSPWQKKNLTRLIVYGLLCGAVGAYVYFGHGKWIDTSVDSLFRWRSTAVNSARDYRGVAGATNGNP